jgi:hypothetical protein
MKKEKKGNAKESQEGINTVVCVSGPSIVFVPWLRSTKLKPEFVFSLYSAC